MWTTKREDRATELVWRNCPALQDLAQDVPMDFAPKPPHFPMGCCPRADLQDWSELMEEFFPEVVAQGGNVWSQLFYFEIQPLLGGYLEMDNYHRPCDDEWLCFRDCISTRKGSRPGDVIAAQRIDPDSVCVQSGCIVPRRDDTEAARRQRLDINVRYDRFYKSHYICFFTGHGKSLRPLSSVLELELRLAGFINWT